MAFHEISLMDVWEVLRRWYDKQSISQIAQALQYDRKTVRRYIRIAMANGLSRELPLPCKEDVLLLLHQSENIIGRTPQTRALLERYLEEIAALIGDPALSLKPKIAFEVLCERHELKEKVSYTSFKRFVRSHQLALYPERATCRCEVPPGREAQIDYCRIGLHDDPVSKRRRTLHAFIGTLSHSRHKFVELVYCQDQASFTSSHVRMFDSFGGVPERIVLDNLKTGVIRPDVYDPHFNRSYRELAEHYGCFLDPARVAHPKDKGKVERDVQTVRQAARKIMVLNPAASLAELNRLMRHWISDDYGQRNHGTTGEAPHRVFLERERPALRALPANPFEVAEWKQATVHPDHYIQFKGKAYSVPHAYITKKVWIRATEKIVQVYYDDQLIKQHLITRGYRHTDYEDFPQNVQAALDSTLHQSLLERAGTIGEHFHHLIRSLLQVHAYINLRKVLGLVTLTEHFNPSLVESAAAFALKHHLNSSPRQFRLLLEKLSAQSQTPKLLPLSENSRAFVRDISYFIHNQEEPS